VLLDHLTSAQLSEWEAYDRLDPIGTWREEYRTAKLCSVIDNNFRWAHGKKGTEMTKPVDYMPDWDMSDTKTSVKKQSPNEIKEFLLRFAKVHNKQIERQKKVRNTPPIKKQK